MSNQSAIGFIRWRFFLVHAKCRCVNATTNTKSGMDLEKCHLRNRGRKHMAMLDIFCVLLGRRFYCIAVHHGLYKILKNNGFLCV